MTHSLQRTLPVCLALFAASVAACYADDPVCETPAFMTRADVRGLGIAEVTANARKTSVYGHARYPKTCVDRETMFEAASLTKPVFAYMVMRLVERGRLSLDDTLLERLPSLPLPKEDPRSARVTIRMALSHSSGLDGPDDRVLRFSEDPGTRFRYYPAGYRLVQRIVEHIEQAPLDEVMRREVFEPLEMGSSALVYRQAYADRLATRHRMLGNPLDRKRDPARPANAAASLLTTPEDYGRFLQAMLTGAVLRRDSIDMMLTPQITADDSDGAIGWGIGWGLELQRGTFFHWGDDGATKCFTLGSRKAGRAGVYFTNSYYGMALAKEMSQRFVPGPTPGVDWLGYGNWDTPNRLARRDTVRAFVERGPEDGMRTFLGYGNKHPELDLYNVAYFAAWILDGRAKHDGRARLLAWQIGQRPENVDLYLERVRSLRAINNNAEALEALRAARVRADASRAETIDRKIRWMEDEQQAAASKGKRPAVGIESLVGTYDARRIRSEGGQLRYQRGEGKAYQLRWMHGTTYAFVDDDIFRVRFDVEDGRGSRIIVYSETGADASPRTGD